MRPLSPDATIAAVLIGLSTENEHGYLGYAGVTNSHRAMKRTYAECKRTAGIRPAASAYPMAILTASISCRQLMYFNLVSPHRDFLIMPPRQVSTLSPGSKYIFDPTALQ